MVYGYWPWGAKFPVFRKAKLKTKKKAILVSSSAAPGFIGRWFTGTIGQLKKSAGTVGGESVGVLFTGMVANKPDQDLTEKTISEIKLLAEKLV